MLFPTFEFFLFFTLVLILNWSLKRWPIIWRLFLLLASYYFYSVWEIKFLLILLFVSAFNFFSGRAIYKNFLGNRKLVLASAIFVNLLVLGIFKYYDFFRVSTELLLDKIGVSANFPLLEIILPIGLSFYIFRAISYNADVCLGKIPAASSFLDFGIYIAFFPQLLSGPIARAGDFLPQLKNGGSMCIDDLRGNFTLILSGLFKKLVISGYLVSGLTDNVFAVPENHSLMALYLAVFAYSLVIYFDFSGYSDMAIGFAGLMGFKSPINFETPYLALDIRDFWRRWHISLSSWVKDYIYIPLGGSRKGRFRKYLNLMTSMFLIGLWHGAAFHYIIWGVLHGIGLVATHLGQDRKKINTHWGSGSGFSQKCRKFFLWFITFNFISFSWIFFRAENMERSFAFIKALFTFERFTEPLKIYIILIMAVGFLFLLFEKQIFQRLVAFQEKLSLAAWFLFAIASMLLLFKFSPDTLPSFIYFGF